MADVFISYKRENQDAVQRVVQGARNAGLSVWWDQDIAPDAPWEQTIESELTNAKVVIVAWSQAAVASENVKAEARRARNQGKLIQVYVEACEPPLSSASVRASICQTGVAMAAIIASRLSLLRCAPSSLASAPPTALAIVHRGARLG